LDAVRERVRRAGMEEGAVTKEKNRDLALVWKPHSPPGSLRFPGPEKPEG
jgi:hypothetical protein